MSIPSWSLEVEQAVIGILMGFGSNHADYIASLGPDDFHGKNHKLIIDAIKYCHATDGETDQITVGLEVEKRGIEDETGGMLYLNELVENHPTDTSMAAYIERLAEYRTRRDILKISELVFDHGRFCQDIDEAVNLVQAEVGRLETGSGYQTRDAQAVVASMSTIMDARMQAKGGLQGLPTGLKDLDEATGGLQPGLIVVGARPKMGKTLMGMGFVEACVREDIPCVYASFEMPAEQLLFRSVSSTSRIPFAKIRDPRNMQGSEEQVAVSAMGRIAEWPLEFIDRSSSHIDRLCSSIRAWAKRHGDSKKLCVIDYLQLIELASAERQDLRIADATRKLKKLSGELAIPIVLLSQLNRSLEQRPNKRPMASDLRDSGSIEQDADLILFIYRDEVYNEQSQDAGIAEIIIGAGREVQAQTVRVATQFQYQCFADLFTGYQG